MMKLKLHSKHTWLALFVGLSAAASAQNDGSNMNKAIADTLVLIADGLEVSVPTFLEPDSVKWEIQNLATHETSSSLVVLADATEPITVYNNAIVTAWVRSHGLWYTQIMQFNAVTQNELSGTLTAPVIANARYFWYFEEELLTITGPEFTPTQIGTYKVSIFWPNPSNARVSGENSAEFIFEVTRLGSVTGIADQSLEAADITLYPSPASENVRIANVKGDFEYAIESLAGTVLAGTGTEMAPINISSLTSGMYIVRIKTGHTELSKKLIVN